MQFTPAPLEGVWVVDSDVFPDDRGLFARAWVPDELRARGLETHVAQCSLSFNHRRGTIRGMHCQVAPFEDTKFIRVTRGAIFDVVIDLRPSSATHGQWFGIELSADNRRALYVPGGLAHGFQTLTDAAELLYLISATYSPAHGRGVRWNDPAFGIAWPLGSPTMINERDASYPDYGS